MDLTILDTKFNTVKILDAYKSLVWTERFNEYGDFELHTEVSGEILKYVQERYYIISEESEKVMIVEAIEIDSDIELGNFIKITGKSLESILTRRIVWGFNKISGNLQNGIKTLINNAIISPSIPERKISNFIFEASTDPKITSLTMDNEYTGDNIYDVINELCILHDIGFKVTLNSNNQFVFSLYAGVDRSYDQTTNPFVIFSPSYENIVNSNYLESIADYKNITLIGGAGEAEERRYTTYGSGSGLERRELFTDARDLQDTVEGNYDEKMPDSQYFPILQKRGKENLASFSEIVAFEGEIEPRIMFVYRRDFYLGDIVQIENEYGKKGTTRITEVLTAHNDEGYKVTPTFLMVDAG